MNEHFNNLIILPWIINVPIIASTFFMAFLTLNGRKVLYCLHQS